MKLNELVRIRVGRARRFRFGVIGAVDLRRGVVEVWAGGVRYLRHPKRVYPAKGKRGKP